MLLGPPARRWPSWGPPARRRPKSWSSSGVHRLLATGWLERPAARRRPSPRRWHQDEPTPRRQPPERSAPSRQPTMPSKSAPPLRRQDRMWLQCSSSPPYPGQGAATMPRTGKHLRTTRHCYRSTLDVTPVRQRLAPTMAYRYGLQVAGPTRQREPGGRQSLASRTRGRPASSRRPTPLSGSVHH